MSEFEVIALPGLIGSLGWRVWDSSTQGTAST